MKKTQLSQIAADLARGKSITPINALNRYGCFRLAARIKDLKDRGVKIRRTTITNRKSGASFASYSLQ